MPPDPVPHISVGAVASLFDLVPPIPGLTLIQDSTGANFLAVNQGVSDDGTGLMIHCVGMIVQDDGTPASNLAMESLKHSPGFGFKFSQGGSRN